MSNCPLLSGLARRLRRGSPARPGRHLRPDPSHGATEAGAGLLLPGFLGQDVFNLLVGVPLLLGSLWFARRGSLVGLLFLPGTLFYALYLTGAPFSVLFLVYVSLVTPSAFSSIGIVSSIDGEEVRRLSATHRAGTSHRRVTRGPGPPDTVPGHHRSPSHRSR